MRNSVLGFHCKRYTDGPATMGICSSYSASAKIKKNSIRLKGADSLKGVYFANTTGTIINKTVQLDDGKYENSFDFTNSTVTMYNNSARCNRVSGFESNQVNGISVRQGNLTGKNNIFDIGSIIAGNQYSLHSIYEAINAPAESKIIENNDFYTEEIDKCSIDTSSNGNIKLDPRLDGPFGFHFSADSPQAVYEGGQVIAELVTDKAGIPRSDPYSMGAYEELTR